MEKQEHKTISRPVKKKLQKISREYYRNLSEDEYIRIRNYVSTKNKNISDADRKKNRIYEKLK